MREQTVIQRMAIIVSSSLVLGFFGLSIAAFRYVEAARVLPAVSIACLVAMLALHAVHMGIHRAQEKRMMETVRRDQEQLRDAVERAESSDRMRQAIIANMSHEFRTPLNSVIGFAELLAEGERDPERQEMARCIQRGGWDLLNLVNSLVRAAELAGGGFSDRQDRFSLPELLAAVEAARGREAKAKGLELQVSCAERRTFKGDLESLSSILGILVGNAVKYSDRGSVALSARELEVADGGRVLVECSVADNGKGMDERTVKRLFEPFAQGEDPLTKRYAGVGIGLYTAKRLSDAVRGDLRVESELGKGTTAYLVVPLELDNDQGERTE